MIPWTYLTPLEPLRESRDFEGGEVLSLSFSFSFPFPGVLFPFLALLLTCPSTLSTSLRPSSCAFLVLSSHLTSHATKDSTYVYTNVYACESVLQSVAECCSVLWCATHFVFDKPRQKGLHFNMSECLCVCECVAECCSVLQCVAECCSVLQSVLQCARPFAFDHPSHPKHQLVSVCARVCVCACAGGGV